MLILSRKIGESVIINETIEVKVIEINGDKIKLGIDAPAEVKVLRNELCQTAEVNRDSANSKSNKKLIDFINDLK
ncbi:MAG TPA: carbon storage regulator CsrA [Clostridiales bacterium]|nr:carbon storage regulator CsrA [Clostridiales bacterium]